MQLMAEPRATSCSPILFFFLHVCTAWPVGVVGLALASSLVKAGVPVQQTATITAASALAFTLEICIPGTSGGLLLHTARLVSRRRRSHVRVSRGVAGCTLESRVGSSPHRTGVRVLVGRGDGGGGGQGDLMAYEVGASARPRLLASGYYTAGAHVLPKQYGRRDYLSWLLDTPSTGLRARDACLSIAIAHALAGATIFMVPRERMQGLHELLRSLPAALVDLWTFVRTRQGMLIAVLCVIPFGSGTEAGLIGAIAREWAVTPDQLAALSVLAVVGGIAGAIISGWLSLRIGPWKTYVTLGWLMIVTMLGFSFAPRLPAYFLAVELGYRALGAGCYAALLGIVLTAIGKGAASTKAAGRSLANLAFVYPALIEGAVHDKVNTRAMLLTDAALGVAGFGVLLGAAWLLGLHLQSNQNRPAGIPEISPRG